MELDQLRYFLRIAELANFTRAGEELGLSQPALSRSIQKLEEELGRPIFERRTGSVSLTEAGTLLQSRARQVLSLLETTKAEITDDGQTGCIRVGAIPTIAPYFLPEVLRRFCGEHPKAKLIVQEDTTDNLLHRCRQGDIDLAVLALPVPSKYLDVEELFDEELLLVLPPDHPLVGRTTIQLKDVDPYPFVLLNEAHCLSENIATFCRQRSFQPVAVERTSQLAMVLELVALSHGVSMIPAMARRLDQSDRRVYRSFTDQKPTRTVAVAWNPYRFQSRLMKRFRQFLKDATPGRDRPDSVPENRIAKCGEPA